MKQNTNNSKKQERSDLDQTKNGLIESDKNNLQPNEVAEREGTSETAPWTFFNEIITKLRSAFSNIITFYWFATIISSFIVRGDLHGVTSFVRAHELDGNSYFSLLRFFHSDAVNLDKLTSLWVKIIMDLNQDYTCRLGIRMIIIVDGIKVAKAGRKMPAVKRAHQESESNTKKNSIWAHILQEMDVLLCLGKQYFTIPLVARIHEGYKLFSNDNSTIIDKVSELFQYLEFPSVLLADAYYCNRKMIKIVHQHNSELITRMRTNSIAYSTNISQRTGRGRHRKYGKKIKLKTVFDKQEDWNESEISLYDKNAHIKYKSANYLIRGYDEEIKIVFVIDGDKKLIFMSTDLSLEATEIIRLYSLRFKIETGFNTSKNIFGSFFYHFWMKNIERLKRNQKFFDLSNKTDEYCEKFLEKINAYHIFMQIGIMARGIIAMICMKFPQWSWKNFGSWMRTMNTSHLPSESVTKQAMRNTYYKFLYDFSKCIDWIKFIRNKQELRNNFSAKDKIAS